MTSLPPLLVPVFMCWLGYIIEPASHLHGFACAWTQDCFVAVNVLTCVPTKPSAKLCSRFQLWNLPLSFPLPSLRSQFVFTTTHPFALACQLNGFAGTWLYAVHLCPSPCNQLSYLDTVSLEHTDYGLVCKWTERIVQGDRLTSSLSKCTEVIGQDIRKPANPIQACLLTRTVVSQAARQTLLPGLGHM